MPNSRLVGLGYCPGISISKNSPGDVGTRQPLPALGSCGARHLPGPLLWGFVPQTLSFPRVLQTEENGTEGSSLPGVAIAYFCCKLSGRTNTLTSLQLWRSAARQGSSQQSHAPFQRLLETIIAWSFPARVSWLGSFSSTFRASCHSF